MSAVQRLATPYAAEQAWDRYAGFARRVADNPRLLADRRFHEDMLRAHREFRELFEALEDAR